jgi:Luciferase-like monooxygenase
MRIGYFMACEEYSPRELLDQARLAERHGFHGLWISDHYRPWIEAQGHSAFVWSVIGALAESRTRASTRCPRRRRTAHRIWPNESLPGELAQVLPEPAHFEQASELVTEAMIGEAVPCGPALERHVAALQEFADAGVDELYVQQIGGNHEAFFAAYEREVLPRFQ